MTITIESIAYQTHNDFDIPDPDLQVFRVSFDCDGRRGVMCGYISKELLEDSDVDVNNIIKPMIADWVDNGQLDIEQIRRHQHDTI